MKTPPLIPVPLLIVTAIAIIAALYLSGCASMDYEWKQERPASIKPWRYVVVEDVDRTCRELKQAEGQVALGRNNACATWRPVGCMIYLPQNAARWIVEHEERHCMGWSH